MINLMYVVLMAMLALNISSEVLNGFSIVEESLNRTTANSSKENEVLYNNFAEQMNKNPQKREGVVRESYGCEAHERLALQLRTGTESADCARG